MKILEQFRKANDRLIKHIEQQIDSLDIEDFERWESMYYIFIDDIKFMVVLHKWTDEYVWDIAISYYSEPENEYRTLKGLMTLDVISGRAKLVKVYSNNILGNLSLDVTKYDDKFHQ